MEKRQRKLIAQFADKLNDDGTISESLYGLNVKKGREAIDQFIVAIETNYLDWDWNNKQFQKLLSQAYRGKPPASPDQLAAELRKSVQDDALKQKLTSQLGSGAKVAAKQAAAPGMGAPGGKQPSVPGKQPINLMRGQTYEITYQNFQGKTLKFKDLTFLHQYGAHAIFTRARPANMPPGKWYRGQRRMSPQDAQKRIQYFQQATANIGQRRYRVHGGKQFLTAAQIPKTWVRMTANAQRHMQSAQQYYQKMISSVHARLKKQSTIRIGLQVQRILAAK